MSDPTIEGKLKIATVEEAEELPGSSSKATLLASVPVASSSTSSGKIVKKKRKFSARIPPCRIKRVMQADEEIGRMTASVPVVLGRAMERFAEQLLLSSAAVAQSVDARTLTIKHMKTAVFEDQKQFGLLNPLVEDIPPDIKRNMSTTPVMIPKRGGLHSALPSQGQQKQLQLAPRTVVSSTFANDSSQEWMGGRVPPLESQGRKRVSVLKEPYEVLKQQKLKRTTTSTKETGGGESGVIMDMDTKQLFQHPSIPTSGAGGMVMTSYGMNLASMVPPVTQAILSYPPQHQQTSHLPVISISSGTGTPPVVGGILVASVPVIARVSDGTVEVNVTGSSS